VLPSSSAITVSAKRATQSNQPGRSRAPLRTGRRQTIGGECTTIGATFASTYRGFGHCTENGFWDGDLSDYCYRVASAVGLIAIEIFGYSNPSARDYAVNLGIAFQLTNILRDVAEDGARGRIYLPREDFERFGCREEDVLAGRYTEPFRLLMQHECSRAGEYYGRARFSLAEEDRAPLAAAEAMRLIYEQLLRRVMFRRYDVFGPKVRLTSAEKAALAIAAWARPHLSFLYRIS
jgi:phytoene synthase